jgi:hypothetical protein
MMTGRGSVLESTLRKEVTEKTRPVSGLGHISTISTMLNTSAVKLNAKRPRSRVEMVNERTSALLLRDFT